MDTPCHAAMADALNRVRQRTAFLADRWGRRPRILLTALKQGAFFPIKALAVQLADLGFDVDLFTAPQQVHQAARMAVENDVHVIGVPLTSQGPLELRTALDAQEARQIVLAVWTAAETTADPRAADLLLTFGQEKEAIAAADRILDRLQSIEPPCRPETKT
jgi:methylmalonyl-CoA mutase cobalamin-binding domain/chain